MTFKSKWYFVTKIVLVIEKKLLKFEAEGQEFAKLLRSLKQFIQTVKGQINFWYQNAFLTCSWRFLRSNKLEQFKFKLKKSFWDLETCRKNRKVIFNVDRLLWSIYHHIPLFNFSLPIFFISFLLGRTVELFNNFMSWRPIISWAFFPYLIFLNPYFWLIFLGFLLLINVHS